MLNKITSYFFPQLSQLFFCGLKFFKVGADIKTVYVRYVSYLENALSIIYRQINN